MDRKMKIENNKSIALAYVLKVDGEIIETVKKEQPMRLIFGQGYLLPKFEENIKGKTIGDTFEFELKAADAYGEIDDDAFVELSKDLFEVDGKIDETLFTLGNIIPMRDSRGNRLNGTVDSISDTAIVMNFNHPLAGCNLNFIGEVVDVHDVTPEELAEMQDTCYHGDCRDCQCHCG
ncbi:MAG: FKBP-type peptidyl-prolyl cis-trans isomerase [Prevotellaceae bacterium]|jgi:FKBP-type peptidyl-prolyl cis-trans isomerase SlyD|nr:FKBP-type peptidyl-prolyl cis-trans isomerase [Prevotellaceae bacterium]